MWTLKTAFADHPQCPICGSVERSPCSLEPGGGNFYLRALFDGVGLDAEAVLERLALWECAHCATLWYDPWLDIDLVASGYGYIAGRHKFGWAALRAWTLGQTRTYFIGRPRLLDLLLALLPGFARYGEVNCPFSGLLFEIQNRRSPDFDRAAVTRKLETLRAMYASASFERDYAPAEVWATHPATECAAGLASLERVLIEAPSPLCWGRSCTFAGANCQALARDLLVDRTASFEAAGADGRRFDAIGLFNTLDHFLDPVAVLDSALALATIVVVDLHAWGWTGAQHFYNVGQGIAAYLRGRGVSVADISAHVTERGRHGDDRRYLLLSRSLDLQAAITRLAAPAP